MTRRLLLILLIPIWMPLMAVEGCVRGVISLVTYVLIDKVYFDNIFVFDAMDYLELPKTPLDLDQKLERKIRKR